MKGFSVVALLGCTLLVGVGANANDSAFTAVGGSMKPMKGQHSSVRMESERVRIDAYAERYDTTVDFVFHNTGRKNVATMGFPESSYGDVQSTGSRMAFLRFRTSVDGVPFKAVRIADKDNSEQDYDHYWVKTVPFNRGQRRRVRVQYSSPYGGTAMMGFSRAIQYQFTGGNWKSDVARSDMEVHVHTPGRWMMPAMWSEGEGESRPLGLRRQGNVLRHTWRHWEAQGTVVMGLVASRPGWLMAGDTVSDSSPWTRVVRSAPEFVVPGRTPTGHEPFQGYPIAGYLRNGVTYLQLAHVTDRLQALAEKGTSASRAYPAPIATSWNAARKMSTLQVGKDRFSWQPGRRTWTVNGQARTLPAAPFAVLGWLYVPAAPLLNSLGATIKVNATDHSVNITAWSPRK